MNLSYFVCLYSYSRIFRYIHSISHSVYTMASLFYVMTRTVSYFNVTELNLSFWVYFAASKGRSRENVSLLSIITRH